MSILVCGSLAFDTVMVFNDKFRLGGAMNERQALDMYFTVPDLRRNFGGCAGNIVYNLKLLGKPALPMGAVGNDFAPYAAWLDNCGINREFVKTIDHSYTAQSFVTVDADDNKITAFHPGAMNFSPFQRVPQNRMITLGVIAPDNFEGMQMHAQQFNQAGIPFLFYPGNALAQMDGNDLLVFIDHTQWVLVNEVEWRKIHKRTGLSPEQVAERVYALIINRGQEGALIYTQQACHHIPGRTPRAVHETTGADDAFCAGLLYGLAAEIDWETTGRIAALMWSIKAEHHGTQSHSFTLEQFKALFKKTFGYALIR